MAEAPGHHDQVVGLGQALGTGVAGAAVAVGARSLGDRSGVALTFAFGTFVGLLSLAVGARVPIRLLAGLSRPAEEASGCPKSGIPRSGLDTS